jgi:hypothetical protein
MVGDTRGLPMTCSPQEQPGQSNQSAEPMPAIEICSVVVTRGNAQPGQELALRQLQGQILRQHLGNTPHAQPGWVLQGVDDPRQVITVHECPTLARYLQANTTTKAQEQLADLLTAPIQHTFYRACAFYENMGVKPTIITGLLIEVPPHRAATLDRLLQLVTWPALKSLPELVLRVCYQEAAAPHRFLLVHGWRSSAAYEGVVESVAASIRPALNTLGAQLTHLVARE